jgi:endoglucanase
MRNSSLLTVRSIAAYILLFAIASLQIGCKAAGASGGEPAAEAAAPKDDRPTVRIKAGVTAPWTDSRGNVWLPDQGFVDGETFGRGPIPIAGTSDPDLYRTERFSMTAFSYPVPDGKYTVKLHFAETFEEIYGPGERIFSVNVEGQHEIKDLDLWAKTGGSNRAYVETAEVKVTDGKLDITFTPKIQNPEINGIEIIPS